MRGYYASLWVSRRRDLDHSEAKETKEAGKTDDTQSSIATSRGVLSALGRRRCGTARAV